MRAKDFARPVKHTAVKAVNLRNRQVSPVAPHSSHRKDISGIKQKAQAGNACATFLPVQNFN
jgi:hypothetical protein